jgi:hypothetical protein
MARKLKIAGGVGLVAVVLALVGLAVWYTFFKKDRKDTFSESECRGGSWRRKSSDGSLKCKPGTFDTGIGSQAESLRLRIPPCHWNFECVKRWREKLGDVAKYETTRKPVGGMFPLVNADAVNPWKQGPDSKPLSCSKPCKRRGMCKRGTSSWNKDMCCQQPWSSLGGCTEPRSHPKA